MENIKESREKSREKRWFITKDNDIRWVKIYINKNIEFDDCTAHLILSMENNLNAATSVSDCKIENIGTENFFFEKKEAQLEILIKERFNEKST